MKVEIRNWDGNVLWSGEASGLLEALEMAVRSRAHLSRAHLSGADLSGADLSRAHLSGAHLSGAHLSGADLSGADLSGADLSGAHLSGADLSGADLSRADLSGAHLSGADLSGAHLSGADLSGADLSGAGGVGAWHVTPLLMLRDQPGLIRAYKLVNAAGEGPFNGGLKYEIDTEISVTEWNDDETVQCAAGINLATADWCIKEWTPGYRILVVEFKAEDIVAIPTATDGKFRVKRCKVIGEKSLEELGLVKAEKSDE